MNQDMEKMFPRSFAMMEKLAKDVAHPPLSVADSPTEYVNQSLTILGQKLDRLDRIDQSFQRVGKAIDQGFEGFNNQLRDHIRDIGQIFADYSESCDVRSDNSVAITHNGDLHRMHQPIKPIKIRRPTADPDRKEWASHPEVPKNMNAAFLLAQHAKGLFEPNWQGKTDQQGMFSIACCIINQEIYLVPFAIAPVIPLQFMKLHRKTLFLYSTYQTMHCILAQQALLIFLYFSKEPDAQRKALQTIKALSRFYYTIEDVSDDEQSDSDAMEPTDFIEFDDAIESRDQWASVDAHMDDLLDAWGMDWDKVVRLATEHAKAQPPQQTAGTKRGAAEESSSSGRRERKRMKARGGRPEEKAKEAS